MYFYNVANLFIKDLKFKGCGSTLPQFTRIQDHAEPHPWASILVSYCTNMLITNVLIYNPVGFGISGFNVNGKNLLENITIIMERYNLHNNNLFTCSYGVHWKYGDGLISKGITYLYIHSVALKQNHSITGICPGRKPVIIQLLLFQCCLDVHIVITDSVFYKLRGKILGIDVASLSYNSIYLYNCSFDVNTVSQAVDVQYRFPPVRETCCPRINVTFAKLIFLHTYPLENIYNNSILQFVITSQFKKFVHLTIVFDNTWFEDNFMMLLKIISNIPPVNNQFSVFATTAGHCIIKSNRNFISRLYNIISLINGKMYFNGTTEFFDNKAVAIIHLSSSMLSFSNSTVFAHNKCDELLHLNCQLCYMELLGRTNLVLSYNIINSQVIKSTIRYNNPNPYCLFQYFSTINSQYDFRIEVHLLETWNSEKSMFEIFKLTSHCKWIPGAAFQNTKPLVVNKNIVHYNGALYPLGTHSTICYCPPSSHYNCSVDQLGPVYPGENLTVDLCLPYNDEEIGVMYAETYNNNLPKSACKLRDYDSMKHVFKGKQSKFAHFAIATEQPTVCELFLTAQPNLYINYDVFYVHLLPCPLGFTLQHGICDCDPDLTKYIDKCMISSQTVRLFAGVYILGIVSDNSTNTYIISDSCPIEYCLPVTTRINLHYPDSQCQPHRTGLLCSQCVEGYSLVFGSNQCENCSNVHLLFILLILLTGLLLILMLFCLNLTVTRGTFNGLILYVNVIQINSSTFQLENRLVMFLYTYVSIFSLSSSFEMCFYNGMDIYIKKWIQLTYPIYLILIAATFILGSRYSRKLYRLTHNRALPVLATLFMLTYTSILQTIASTPLYTTIITIPSHSSKNLWLLDPTISLFGWKFLLLISVCLLLFLFLLMFKVILLFTKPLMRFKIIHRFKPLIDAFQGPIKSQYYYWIGIQLLIRNLMVLFSVFGKTVNTLAGCITIMYITIIHGYTRPNKNAMINIQELLLLSNISTLCLLLMFNSSETLNVVAVNALIGLSFFHCLLILLYHILVFVSPCRRMMCTAKIMWSSAIDKLSCCRGAHEEVHQHIEIPEVDFNLANFQEPLIGEDQ